MAILGKVRNGKILLAKPCNLPDGTEVEVRRARKPKVPVKKPKSKQSKAAPRSLADRLRNVIGKAKNLPLDASTNHDHYLYGLPKQP